MGCDAVHVTRSTQDLGSDFFGRSPTVVADMPTLGVPTRLRVLGNVYMLLFGQAKRCLRRPRPRRRPAGQYRATLAEANGSYFEAARLRAPGDVPARVGYAYFGRPSWIFVSVDAAHRSTAYTVELAMSGERVPLPSLRIDAGTGSAGAAIPVDVHRVAAIRLVGRTRGDVLEARLPHAAGDDK